MNVNVAARQERCGVICQCGDEWLVAMTMWTASFVYVRGCVAPARCQGDALSDRRIFRGIEGLSQTAPRWEPRLVMNQSIQIKNNN